MKKITRNRRFVKKARRFSWLSWRKAAVFLAIVGLGFVLCFAYHSVRVSGSKELIAAAVAAPEVETKPAAATVTYYIDDHSTTTYNSNTDVGGVVVLRQDECCPKQPSAVFYDFSNRLQQIQQNYTDLSSCYSDQTISVFNLLQLNAQQNNWIQNETGNCFRRLDFRPTENTVGHCVPQPGSAAAFLMFGFLQSSFARRR